MKKLLFPLWGLCTLFMVSCGEEKKSGNWLQDYEVEIAIDETFQPILSEAISQFNMKYVEADMKPYYVSEDSAIHMLLDDSVRCCVATRKLTDVEKKIVKQRVGHVMQSTIASDAIALVVSKDNPDTLITVDELRDIVSGKITRWEQLERGQKKGEIKVVFDNSPSSTVRYMTDSLCRSKKLEGNLYAQGSNLEAIQAARDNKDVIAIVGVDWLRKDSVIKTFYDLDVNVMMVSKKGGKDADYFRPYQYYIATGDYPLVRSVYVITSDPRRQSLTKNFYYFIKGNSGQLLICNGSQLLPYTQVQVRDTRVTG
jgi:phosphate transport system substrate-binding protein